MLLLYHLFQMLSNHRVCEPFFLGFIFYPPMFFIVILKLLHPFFIRFRRILSWCRLVKIILRCILFKIHKIIWWGFYHEILVGISWFIIYSWDRWGLRNQWHGHQVLLESICIFQIQISIFTKLFPCLIEINIFHFFLLIFC